jgi:hypothetical protein
MYGAIWHISFGWFLGALTPLGFYPSMAIHTIWEIWRHWTGRQSDNWRNLADTLIDTLFFVIGLLFGLYADRKNSLFTLLSRT